jgi:superfamily II DNA or RNA helicase
MSYKLRENLLIKEAAESLGTHAVFPYSNKLKKKFTTNVFFSEEPIELYQIEGDKILLPRGVCLGGCEVDNTVSGQKITFPNNIKLRDSQVPVISEALPLLLKDNPENFIIQSGTGTGKTVMGLYLIAKVGRPALVVVHRDFLMHDVWAKFAKEILGLPEGDIGFIQGDTCDYKGKKLVIGMVHSLSKKDRYPKDMYNYFGQVYFDECERMSSDQFSKAIALFPAKIRVGLSATPRRKDGKMIVFESHIGPVKVRLDSTPLTPKVIIIKSSWKVPMVTWYNEYQPLPHEFGKTMHINKHLANDYDRNKLLVNLIVKVYSKGRNLIVFSDLARDKHLDTLKGNLLYYIPEEDIDFLVGGTSKINREIAMRKRVILSTYSYFGAGGDIPWADTLIMATPRSDVVQFIGRICREYPDKKTPVVIDIQDNDSYVLKAYGDTRLKQYIKAGAEIKYG